MDIRAPGAYAASKALCHEKRGGELALGETVMEASSSKVP
jgi:hypothetical protein